MTLSGIGHFTATDKFATIVPPFLGNANAWVWGSGVAELTTAAAIAAPRTRRLGGLMAAVLFVLVFPGNVYAALKGGYRVFSPPFDSPAIAWLRLPLQLLLIWWALLVRRDASHAENQNSRRSGERRLLQDLGVGEES